MLYQQEVEKSDYLPRLKQAGDHYLSKSRFCEGDIVEWKPNMKSLTIPAYSAPAIVVDVLDEQFMEQKSTLFTSAEVIRYDMHIGVIDGDGDFVVLKADSARFQKWQS